MKKLFYVGALSALLLAACGEERTESMTTYKVGADIEAGEYLIISDNSTSTDSFIKISTDNIGTSESTLYSARFENNEHMYTTITDNQYLIIKGATFYTLDDAPSIIPEDGVYKNGQFKVGTDIPAGEYTYIVDKNDSSAFIEVSTSSIYDVDNIILSETPTVDGSITLTDGQYLTLQGVHIETK